MEDTKGKCHKHQCARDLKVKVIIGLFSNFVCGSYISESMATTLIKIHGLMHDYERQCLEVKP